METVTVLGTLGILPPFRHNLEMNLSGLSRRAAAELPPS